ncbi:MAG: SRPBCC family protein [Planctomycetaceae bacterium]
MSQTEVTPGDEGRSATPPDVPVKPVKRGKALKIIGWCVGVPVGLFALLMIVGMLLPSTFAVERSIVIDAQPDEIHSFVVDLKRWDDWSPWSKKQDPEKYADLSFTYDGASVGTGAIRRWEDPNMPDGWQKITFAQYSQGIRYDIQFGDSEDTMTCEIRYRPIKRRTRVTWTARSDIGNNPINRWMMVLMKPAFERDYDAGLTRLKELAEKVAAKNRKMAEKIGESAGPTSAGAGGPVAGPVGPGGRGPGRGGPGGRGGFNPQAIIARMMQRDKNKDGKLTKDELDPQRGARLLERADENKDGALTKAELEKAFRRGGRRGGGRGRPGGRGKRPGGDRNGGRPQRPPLDAGDGKKPTKPPADTSPAKAKKP